MGAGPKAGLILGSYAGGSSLTAEQQDLVLFELHDRNFHISPFFPFWSELVLVSNEQMLEVGGVLWCVSPPGGTEILL